MMLSLSLFNSDALYYHSGEEKAEWLHDVDGDEDLHGSGPPR
jgi:hypothetical protein